MPLCLAAHSNLRIHSWAPLSQATRVLRHCAWEKLHSGPWQAVPTIWRDVYSFAAILDAVRATWAADGAATHAAALQGALKALDLAIIMGGPRFAADAHTLLDALAPAAALAAAASAATRDPPALDTHPQNSLATSPPSYPHARLAAPPNSASGDRDPDANQPLREGHADPHGSAPTSAARTPRDLPTHSEAVAPTAAEHAPPNKRARHDPGVEPQPTLSSAATGVQGADQLASDLPPCWPSMKLASASAAAQEGGAAQVQLECADAPDMEAFLQRYMQPGTPVVLNGLVDQWPALERCAPCAQSHTSI